MVITIIGSGGKTSLLWAFAAQNRKKRVLVTTTTRIQAPNAALGLYDTLLVLDEKDESRFSIPASAPAGITLAGSIQHEADGSVKFRSLPLELLETLIPLYDYVFIEGDGSRTLPLKAWADWEPVLTESTILTVGVIPLWPLGKKTNDQFIHRLKLWTELTGAEEDSIITKEHITRAITGWNGRRGLFDAAKGSRILLFNQIEDREAFSNAVSIASLLKERSFKLDLIIAGSIKNSIFEKI
ncbi:MAG: selenium cofactor biosynthesis protein YqeC [Termitinemataceae bacterium]|nr:MAG: selenium cofactor biosynthesis protein YqeC [Termitinemataceae bacterium]